VIAAMAKVRRPFDLTTPAQAAAVASVGDEAEIARRRAVNEEGLRHLGEIVGEHGFAAVPSVGNFVYVDTGTDGNELFERLLREGIIVRPLTGFGSPNAIRVSVGTPDELDAFAAALQRVLSRA
jgi:histidinol-phosphate aminotransferase